jgi:HAMP domain-containing protein
MQALATTVARNALPLWRRTASRLAASLLTVAIVGILLSGYLQYRELTHDVQEVTGTLLLNIARTGALLVDGDQHQAVVTRGRNDTPAYAAIRAQLQRIQEANQLKEPVYTLTDVTGEKARLAVTSQGQEPVGKEYLLAPEIRSILRQVVTEGKPAFTPIYSNERGAWMTGVVPIVNRKGKAVALLKVDHRADLYLAALADFRRNLLISCLIGAAVAVLGGILLARQVTRPIAELSALARSVVEGDLTARARIRARTEIGTLADVFHLMVQRLHASNRSIVAVVERALETRAGEPGSLRRLAAAALAVGERLELTASQQEALEFGALFHDIGEVRTPEAILYKAGPLTSEERAVMQRHPVAGMEILETVPLLTPALDVVGTHHERYDGSGYPRGAKGEEIPLTGRIFAVVDTLDAMTHARPYRPARPLAAALDVVREGSGALFDPRVADVVLGIPAEHWAELLQCARTEQREAISDQPARAGVSAPARRTGES